MIWFGKVQEYFNRFFNCFLPAAVFKMFLNAILWFFFLFLEGKKTDLFNSWYVSRWPLHLEKLSGLVSTGTFQIYFLCHSITLTKAPDVYFILFPQCETCIKTQCVSESVGVFVLSLCHKKFWVTKLFNIETLTV